MAEGPIEQLHYTWARRGVEGRNRFQIAAISPGLKASAMASLLPAVRKICRYDRPRADAERLPVSFGWFDHRGHRIAFCRVGLPRSPGKRGSFAAHVLVGPPERLGEADIASTFGSPFWWAGIDAEEDEESAAGERDFELPVLSVEDLLRGRIEPDGPPAPATLVLAHGLLTLPSDKRLAVLDEDGELGPALRLLARRLPEALTGISLSTYEGGVATFPFRVVGATRQTSRSLRCDLGAADALDPEARQLLECLLGGEPEHALLREAARGIVGRGAPATAAALWRAAGSLALLTSVEGELDAATRALAQPDAVVYVSGEPAGRANLVEAVRAGGSAVLQALRAAWERIEPDSREQLCRGMAERYIASGDLAGIAAAAGALPDRPAHEAILDAVATAAAAADEQLCRSLGPDDAVALIGRAADRRAPVDAIGGLLRGASGHVDHCAQISALPQSYLAAMSRAALGDPGSDLALVAALRGRPAILAGVELDEEEKDRALGFLERLPAARLEGALPALLPSVADLERKPRLDVLLGRLSTGSAGRCLAAAAAMREAQGGEASPGLSALCDDQAAVLIAHGVTPLALELLTRSRSAVGPIAAKLLRGTIHRTGEPTVSLAARAAALEHDALRAAIVDRAMDCAVDDVRRPAGVDALWATLVDLYPDATDVQRLERLLDHGLRSADGSCGAPLLAWVALSLLPVCPKLLGRGGRLRERRVEESAKALAAAAPWHRMEEMEPYVEQADRRCAAWWKDLAAHAKKEARRRERRSSRVRPFRSR